MKATVVATLFVALAAPAGSRAMPLAKAEAPIALEQASGGCGPFAYRTPWGDCAAYGDHGRTSASRMVGSNGGWGRPLWQGGDSGYHSGGAGWRGGGYYGPLFD